MHQLLRLPGNPVENDEVVVSAIEFWNTFVEFVTDSGHSAEPSAWLDLAKAHMMQMVEEFWAKICIPPPDFTKNWDNDTKTAFASFRLDVQDLLQSSHVMLGDQLLEGFAHLALETLSHRDWRQVEATLFCLNALADSLNGDDAENQALLQVFGSSLFPDLSSLDSSIPARTRRTAVDMVGHYAEFFERHTEVLPAVLNFLFTSLGAAALADTAARSVASLCSSCRASLTLELDAFFQQYERFLTWPTAASFTKAKVIGAIAAIVQALPTDESRACGLQRLLDFVDKDVELSLACMAAGQVEQSQVAGVTALESLASIGRSSQAPDDVPIDLEQNDTGPNYWHDGPGSVMQQRIARFIGTVVDILGEDGDVIEAACNVLRSGYSEAVPGPFVLPPQVTIEFLSRVKLETPRLDVVHGTICAFLASHASDKNRTPSTSSIEGEAGAILQHIYGLIKVLGNPRADPEVSQSCMDVLCRFVPAYASVLLQPRLPGALHDILNFAIECLTVPEPLTKRSASSFWVSSSIRFMPSVITWRKEIGEEL